MTESPPQGEAPQASPTITSLLVNVSTPAQWTDLEAFRVAWEKSHGPTDITRYYTSRWPVHEQDALMAVDPERYYRGLPPYVQAWVLECMKTAKRNGTLDDAPPTYLKLFLSGQMRPSGNDDRSVGR